MRTTRDSKKEFTPNASFHKAKKSLGQNFLKSEPALRMMCEGGAVTSKDIIVEIGPGKGALTAKLLEHAGKVIAVEKDRELVSLLEERFKDDIKKKKLEIVDGDILQFDPKTHGLKEGMYKIIANIPYNITGAIIRYFLSETIQPQTMVLLVQKEVAERIVARDNKESILSLSVKAYGIPKYMMKVGKRFFTPAPKVDSAIIAINNISGANFKSKEEEVLFFNIVKAGFAHKRKVLRKNLEDILSSNEIGEMFETLHIDNKSRAEDIAFPVWILMCQHITSLQEN